MKARQLSAPEADHLIVEAIRKRVVPASWLPRVLSAWEEPTHEEFAPRTAWSLVNVFTEVLKGVSPRAQMEGSLRLSAVVRGELQIQ